MLHPDVRPVLQHIMDSCSATIPVAIENFGEDHLHLLLALGKHMDGALE